MLLRDYWYTTQDDQRFYRCFSIDRGFAIPLWAEKIPGKRISYG